MNTATAPRIDLVAKLLARSLDPGAPAPEAQNSALKMVEIARRDSVGVPSLLQHLAIVSPPTKTPQRERPVDADRVMEYGKHCGMTLEKIGRHFPKYLVWMIEEIRDEEMRVAAYEVHSWLRRKGAA